MGRVEELQGAYSRNQSPFFILGYRYSRLRDLCVTRPTAAMYCTYWYRYKLYLTWYQVQLYRTPCTAELFLEELELSRERERGFS
eukprot:scaffold95666_cov42-Attheya_sp.AAC.3